MIVRALRHDEDAGLRNFPFVDRRNEEAAEDILIRSLHIGLGTPMPASLLRLCHAASGFSAAISASNEVALVMLVTIGSPFRAAVGCWRSGVAPSSRFTSTAAEAMMQQPQLWMAVQPEGLRRRCRQRSSYSDLHLDEEARAAAALIGEGFHLRTHGKGKKAALVSSVSVSGWSMIQNAGKRRGGQAVERLQRLSGTHLRVQGAIPGRPTPHTRRCLFPCLLLPVWSVLGEACQTVFRV